MAIARAEDAPTGEQTQEVTPVDDSNSVSGNTTNSDNSDNTDTNKTDTTQNATAADNNQENPQELWKTCKLDDLFEKINDEKSCDECKKKTTCGEIEICLTAKIEIENDANINTDIETAANTGENIVNVTDVPTRNVEERLEVQVQRDEVREEATDQINLDNLNENQTSSTEVVENIPNENQTTEQPERDMTRNRDNDKDKSSDEKDESEESSAEITTGDAVAVTDVVNEVNTTIIGENGVETVENIYGDAHGDINLLDTFNTLLENAENTNNSNLFAFDAVEISIENEADVDNDVKTEANTGKNEIDNETEDGDSVITTGDAIAVANVVNIVNNNIIGNNFLFVVINIFGNWIGDLIVPGEGLLTVPQTGQPANFVVDAENNTNIENDVQTSANSGENSIENEGGAATVQTGDAFADDIVTNQVGSTIVANNWFFLAVNNMGNWVGNVLNWNEEKNGYDTIFSFDFDEADDPEGEGIAGWFTKIFIKNDADIQNDIETTANSGENEIENEGGSANITTGNAYAFSKIFNLVNNNFIGSNWMFAVVNIFGSWQGNVEFAYPDLSVALSDNVGKVRKGDSFSYQIIVRNNGHADCKNVRVGIDLPDSVEYRTDTAGAGAETSGNDYTWNLAGLKAGGEKSFSVDVALAGNAPDDLKFLESQAAVATDTKEIELGNNVSSDQIEIYDSSVAIGTGSDPTNVADNTANANGESSQNGKNSAISVIRSVSKEKIEVGQITKHTIIAQNTGNTALTNVVVSDKVTNKNGAAGDYSWNVEKLEPGKKMVVTYKMMVNAGAPTGDYRNKSVAWGYDENENEVRSNEAGIKVAVSGLKNQESENYYYTYYTYTYPESAVSIVEDGSELIPTAEAATDENPGQVKGEWTNLVGVCRTLPWWGWLFAGIVYLTVIHWSLARQRKAIKSVKD